MFNLIALVASLIPAVLTYLWIRNRILNEEKQKLNCRSALKKGLLCAVPVVFLSLGLDILLNVLKFDNIHPLVKETVYNFVVLAFSEELVKRLMLKKLEKQCDYTPGFEETVCYMLIIGLGFEINESILYSFSTNIMQILVRGLLMMHGVFGYIMGRHLAISRKTGSRKQAVLSFLLPWLMHGAYDFSLSEQLMEINDNFVFFPFVLVLINIIIMIRMFIFLKKTEKSLHAS